MPDSHPDPIQRWSTADVLPSARAERFALALSEAIFPLRVDRTDSQALHAEVSAARLGEIVVCRSISTPFGLSRGRREIAETQVHTFNLAMTLDASWTAEHRRDLRMLPHDVLVIDSEYPLRATFPQPVVVVNVAITAQWLRRWLPDPRGLVARRIPGDSPWGQALSSYLGELTPELALAPPLPLSVIADQIGSLLALTATAMHGGGARQMPVVRSLHDRIVEGIRQRCTTVNLTAADVARSLDISVRTLHRALMASGETFGAQLIDARAQVALRMLGTPTYKLLTTTEIGRRSGFLSPSHFSRVMRRQTGLTPTQLRRSAGMDGRQAGAGEGSNEG